jgi:2-C-methyl-D-erythritol 4-phosphate cytidylyltransferase
MKSRSIIITAGGAGTRMGTAQPKQFLLLSGKPVLMHTIEKLHFFAPDAQLLLTLPENATGEWEDLCSHHSFQIPLTIVSGGAERYHSVKNALGECTGDLIAVHDGVRPLVSSEALERIFAAAEENEAVVPVVPLKDSIREVENGSSRSVPRSNFRIVQTPQVFHAALLRRAYQLEWTEGITDDAGLAEAAGAAIFLTEGNEENIKITVPSDLILAEALIAHGETLR